MKAAEWKRAVRPHLGSGWKVSEKLAYRTPIGWVLYGLFAEDSSLRGPGFYLWKVRLPLFAPTDVLDLSWSDRVGGPSHVFQPGDAKTARALEAAAADIGQEADMPVHMPIPAGGPENLRMQEVHGLGLIIEGDARGALEALEPVTRYPAKYSWEREMVSRAASMRALIEGGQTSEAVRRVEAWRADSIAALGLRADSSAHRVRLRP
jgi:hypothetical protein